MQFFISVISLACRDYFYDLNLQFQRRLKISAAPPFGKVRPIRMPCDLFTFAWVKRDISQAFLFTRKVDINQIWSSTLLLLNFTEKWQLVFEKDFIQNFEVAKSFPSRQ